MLSDENFWDKLENIWCWKDHRMLKNTNKIQSGILSDKLRKKPKHI